VSGGIIVFCAERNIGNDKRNIKKPNLIGLKLSKYYSFTY